MCDMEIIMGGALLDSANSVGLSIRLSIHIFIGGVGDSGRRTECVTGFKHTVMPLILPAETMLVSASISAPSPL